MQTQVTTGLEKHKKRQISEMVNLRQEAKTFLSYLPLDLQTKIVSDFIDYLDTQEVNQALGEKIRSFCIKDSKILQFPIGSWKLTEKIYTDDYSGNFFDKYIVSCISGRATHNRFFMVVRKVSQMISGLQPRHIWSLGSGIGSDLIQMFVEHQDFKTHLQATCFEMDEGACLAGNSLAQRFGLGDNFRFIGGDFRKTARRTINGGNSIPEIALMVGIICPMTTKDSTRLLKLLKPNFKSGSVLVVSSVIDHMLKQDPFSCYLVHLVMDWKLIFKSPAQFKNLVEEAGYKWGGIFTDKYGYHGMAICYV